jgi:hypothetical protein
MERRRGQELGDLGGELPVQIARADAAPAHAFGVDRSFSRWARRSLVAAAAPLAPCGFWGFPTALKASSVERGIPKQASRDALSPQKRTTSKYASIQMKRNLLFFVQVNKKGDSNSNFNVFNFVATCKKNYAMN